MRMHTSILTGQDKEGQQGERKQKQESSDSSSKQPEPVSSGWAGQLKEQDDEKDRYVHSYV